MSSNLKLFKCRIYQPVLFSFDSEGKNKEEKDIKQSNVDVIKGPAKCCVQVPSELTYITH